MKSIQNKMSLFITLLICMTAVTIAVFSLWMFYDNTIGQLQEDTSALGIAYSHAISNQILGFKKELELTAALPDVSQGDAAQRDALLQKIADDTGFQYLAIADNTGKTTRNSDISQREYFQKALAGETFMSSPLINMVDGTVTIMMAAPIENGQGVLYGGIPYDTFSQIIRDIKIGDGGYAFVVDAGGVFVAHPDTALVEGMVNYIQQAEEDSAVRPIAGIIARMASGETAAASSEYSGELRQYAFAPLEGPEGWSVAVSVPMGQIMARIYTAITVCLGVSLALMVAGMIAAILLSRSITRPLAAATHRIELLAQGNLTDPVPSVKGRDEIARLCAALGRTVTQLRGYIGDISGILTAMANNDFTAVSDTAYMGEFLPIRNALDHICSSLNQTLSLISTATDQVAGGADQIAMSAQNLASNASQQAAAVEELTEGITRVSQQDAKNLDSLHTAVGTMENANAGVQESAKGMVQLNTAMNQIASSSEQIGNITRLIEDIAFQTNILALNAAIEAARAGNAGKGFAVVAGEVRTLAAKSSDAARRTAELIQDSVASVNEGLAVTQATAQRLADVAVQTDEAARSIQSIQDASGEQAMALAQLSQSVLQVATAVQANAATAQQSSASSQEFSAIAGELKREVARFRLMKNKKGAGPAKAAPQAGAIQLSNAERY